jgi:predicted nucleic-acid-binding protein
VLVRLATQDDAEQAALALHVLAGLALLESGGGFVDGVIAFEGELLGGQEFVTFDHMAAKLLKNQKRKVRLLQTG